MVGPPADYFHLHRIGFILSFSSFRRDSKMSNISNKLKSLLVRQESQQQQQLKWQQVVLRLAWLLEVLPIIPAQDNKTLSQGSKMKKTKFIFILIRFTSDWKNYQLTVRQTSAAATILICREFEGLGYRWCAAKKALSNFSSKIRVNAEMYIFPVDFRLKNWLESIEL